MDATPMDARLATLRARLAKKGTFFKGVGELRQLVIDAYEDSAAAEQAQMYALVTRVKTLLVSRYTSPPAWRAGCGLFLSAVSFMAEQERQDSLHEWVLLAENVLQEGEVKELRREAEERADAARPAAAPPRAAVAEGAAAAAAAGMPGGSFDPAADLSQGEIAQSLMGFFAEAGLVGGDAGADATAGIDLQAMMEQMMMMGGQDAEPVGAPPASRDARDALLLKTIEAAGQTCAICCEDFVVKDKAKQLPCKHLYHEACVIEWLERHNSCPVCRFALESEKQTWDDEADEIRDRNPTDTGLYS